MKEVNVCELVEVKSKKKMYSQPQLEEMGKMKVLTKNSDKDGSSATDSHDGPPAEGGNWIGAE